MSTIIHDKWGGLIPKLDALALPPTAATLAKNIDLTGGKLAPAKFTTPFQRLHDDAGKMVGQLVAVRDVMSVQKPSDTANVAYLRQCNSVTSWLSVRAAIWLSYVHPDTGVFTLDERLNAVQGYASLEYTSDGIKIHYAFDDVTASIIPGVVYTVHGPKYQFHFLNDVYYRGGPSTSVDFPNTLDFSSADFPVISLPLEWPTSMANYAVAWGGTRYTYGYMKLLDINGPTLQTQLYLDPDDPNIKKLEWPITLKVTQDATLDVYLGIDYVQRTDRLVYYLRTYIDQTVAKGVLNKNYSTGHRSTIELKDVLWDDDDIPATGRLVIDPDDTVDYDKLRYTSWSKAEVGGVDVWTFNIHASDDLAHSRSTGKLTYIEDATATEFEGPPSALTNMLSAPPGIIIGIDYAEPVGKYLYQKIYRSATGGDDFQCLDELHTIGGYFWDDFTKPYLYKLPPYGNFPQADITTACEGSVLHPAQWGATINGNELRPTDLYRFHAFPDEYAVPFDTNIMALVVGGGSIIIFTEANATTGEQGKVYMVSGTPGALAVYELANVSPLLQKTSIARIDQTVFYASRDGLMAISGGGVPSLITRDLFRRPEWTNERPDLMQAWVCDRGLFLIVEIGGHNNLRFDTQEGAATLTRFTKLTGINEFEWRSRPFDFGQPVELVAAQVHADVYPVVIALYDEDGLLAAERAVGGSHTVLLPRARRSRVWSYGARATGTVYRIALATSAAELPGG